MRPTTAKVITLADSDGQRSSTAPEFAITQARLAEFYLLLKIYFNVDFLNWAPTLVFHLNEKVFQELICKLQACLDIDAVIKVLKEAKIDQLFRPSYNPYFIDTERFRNFAVVTQELEAGAIMVNDRSGAFATALMRALATFWNRMTKEKDLWADALLQLGCYPIFSDTSVSAEAGTAVCARVHADTATTRATYRYLANTLPQDVVQHAAYRMEIDFVIDRCVVTVDAVNSLSLRSHYLLRTVLTRRQRQSLCEERSLSDNSANHVVWSAFIDSVLPETQNKQIRKVVRPRELQAHLKALIQSATQLIPALLNLLWSYLFLCPENPNNKEIPKNDAKALLQCSGAVYAKPIQRKQRLPTIDEEIELVSYPSRLK